MLNSLSESLIIEILSWLPVQSLLEFKFVCKSWYKITKSPYFISMHLKHNYGRCRTNSFIAQYAVTDACNSMLKPYLVWHGESDQGNTIQEFSTLESRPYRPNYNICGPCYGIYYLWDRIVKFGYCANDSRCLWNPALKKTKKLPPMIMKPNISSNLGYYNEYCGFGYDPVTADYKVVAIKGYITHETEDDPYGWDFSSDYPLSIMIYSLRTDSWKYLGDLSKLYYIRDNSCHTFVNRCLYWLGSNDELETTTNNGVIIAIDLAMEEVQEIGLPDNICIKNSMTYDKYSGCLMVYNSSIALVALFEEECTFDIWTLKGTTWSKELTVKLDYWVRSPIGHYSMDNNLVLFDSPDCLILCNPNTKETSKFKFHVREGASCKTVSAYMESLVPLNDRDFWGHKDEDQENHNKCKRRRFNNNTSIDIFDL